MLDFSKIPKLISNPKAVVPSVKNLIIDLANDLQEWPYKHHIIVICGLPKSGTNWLWSMFQKIPGYNPCPGPLRPIKLTKEEQWNHDLSQSMFDALPKDKYTVVKTHTRPTDANLDLLLKNNAKILVLVRDLRDVAVSRYVHELNDKKSWCYKLYTSNSQEVSFWHNLTVMNKHYVRWLHGWKYFSCIHRSVNVVKYENLEKHFPSILSNFEIYYDWLWVEEVTKNKKLLKDSLNKVVASRCRGTYSGERRNWKDFFTEEQELWFKSKAETAMRNFGYSW